MWSVGLIAGIAVAASMTLLTVGVLLTIAFERRRYRKYIQRHTAGTLPIHRSQVNGSTDNVDHDYQSGSPSLGKTGQYMSPTSWIALPSSDSVEVIGQPASPTNHETLATARRRSLRKTLQGPIKKKHYTRRRLKRTVPLAKVINPPMPAIFEASDCSRSSSHSTAGRRISISTSAKEDYTPIEPDGWSFSISKSRITQDASSLRRMHSTGHSIEKPRPVYVPRSFSMASSLTSAPGEALPPLPVSSHTTPLRIKRKSSCESMDSVGSSVLGSTVHVTDNTSEYMTERSKSQALQDFDFEISPIMRLRSPAQSSTRYEPSPRAAAVTSMRASISPDPILQNRSLMTRDGSVRTVNVARPRQQTGLGWINRADRNSMFESYTNLDRYHMDSFQPPTDDADPFAPDKPLRPHSVQERIPLRELDNGSSFYRSPIQPFGIPNGHKRRNRVKTSNLPLMPPPLRTKRPVHVLDPEKRLSDVEIRNKNLQKTTSYDKMEKSVQKLSKMIESDSVANLQYNNRIRSIADGAKRSTPATPTVSGDRSWLFDFIPCNTPKIQSSPSPYRSYNSPILPSPAYSPADLCSRPRQSQVHGPRAPRNQPQSPLRSRPRTKYGSINRGVKHTAHGDLRKSVQMLRSMNSEAHLLAAEQRSTYHRLGRVTEDCDAPVKIGPDRIHGVGSKLYALSEQYRNSPVGSTTAGVKLESQSKLPSARSSITWSRMSIWDDISIHEDSPEPEILKSIPSEDVHGRSLANGPSMAEFEDCETHENYVALSKNKTPLQENNTRSFAVGLGIGGGLVPETPGSMYDESGFLKEPLC